MNGMLEQCNGSAQRSYTLAVSFGIVEVHNPLGLETSASLVRTP